jgi:hypothetical protein
MSLPDPRTTTESGLFDSHGANSSGVLGDVTRSESRWTKRGARSLESTADRNLMKESS